MSTKGKTRWFPRYIHPVRNGFYECEVRLMGGLYTNWMLPWDGKGFLVPFPMTVLRWRGQTIKAAHGIRSKA
jgi:hypothetical protein